MCFTPTEQPDQYQCACLTWTGYTPSVPNKPKNQCLRCFTKGLPSPLSVAVDRMSDAVLTDTAGESMGVGYPLARLGPGGDFITEIKP